MIPIIIRGGLPVEAAEEAVTLPQAPAVVDVGPKLPEAASLPAAAAPVAGGAPTELWTEAEENRLIDMTVRQMLDGAPKSRAIAFAATEIGRSEKSASSRLYNKLKARFAEALAVASSPKPQTAKGEQTGIQAGAPAEPAAGEGVAAPASPPAPPPPPPPPPPPMPPKTSTTRCARIFRGCRPRAAGPGYAIWSCWT